MPKGPNNSINPFNCTEPPWGAIASPKRVTTSDLARGGSAAKVRRIQSGTVEVFNWEAGVAATTSRKKRNHFLSLLINFCIITSFQLTQPQRFDFEAGAQQNAEKG